MPPATYRASMEKWQSNRSFIRMYDAISVIQYLETQFPLLSIDLHDDVVDGLLHLQIGVFSRHAQTVIDEARRDEWNDITAAFVKIYTDCSPNIANAMNVSFLEHLNFADGRTCRAWAYDAMPPGMKDAWDKMEAYNRRLHGS
jgi:hypothetical protein